MFLNKLKCFLHNWSHLEQEYHIQNHMFANQHAVGYQFIPLQMPNLISPRKVLCNYTMIAFLRSQPVAFRRGNAHRDFKHVRPGQATEFSTKSGASAVSVVSALLA